MSYSEGDVFISLIEDFVTAVEQHRPPLATGVDGLRSIEIHQGVYQSARTRQAVALAA